MKNKDYAKDMRDRFPNEYYYGVFCMIDVAKGYNPMLEEIIQRDEANDIAWVKGIELYDNFLESKYNRDYESEIDCMEDYIINLNQQT